MRPLRALTFRRFTLPSIADIVWAKQVRFASAVRSQDRREMYRRRLSITLPPLLMRLELINTLPRLRARLAR